MGVAVGIPQLVGYGIQEQIATCSDEQDVSLANRIIMNCVISDIWLEEVLHSIHSLSKM